jgi:hypothetical protein
MIPVAGAFREELAQQRLCVDRSVGLSIVLHHFTAWANYQPDG